MAENPDDHVNLEYWRALASADHAASQDYDKAVMALAGGALGLSLSFIKDVVKEPVPGSVAWIAASWMLLTIALLSTLVSMLASQRALRTAMRQLRGGGGAADHPGGAWSRVTHVCNASAALMLVLGLAGMICFATLNYEGGHLGHTKVHAEAADKDSRNPGSTARDAADSIYHADSN